MIPYNKPFMGRGSYGNPQICWWGEDAEVKIGNFCSIADNVKIFIGGEHNTKWITTYPFSALMPEFSHIKGHPATKGNVIIDNDVWIGYGATILSGTYICSGAVIGANAVVRGYIPPYSIWVGNPAKQVGTRFYPGEIEALINIAWWDWSDEQLKKAIPYLLSSDIGEFIHRYVEGEFDAK